MNLSEITRSFTDHPNYKELPVPVQFAVTKLVQRDHADYTFPADIKIYNIGNKKLFYISFTDRPIEITFTATSINVSTPSMKTHKLDTILMVYRTSKVSTHELNVDEDDTDSHEDITWDFFSYNEDTLKELIKS